MWALEIELEPRADQIIFASRTTVRVREEQYFEMKSLIMAQIERWRQVSYMQVERGTGFGRNPSGGRVSNA